jgi:amino acid permease (GABA permease)
MTETQKEISSQIADPDVERLHELGYAQELGRRMQGFSNMAVSFSIISILAGCLTTFYLALYAGGGPVLTFGWPLVTLMSLCVALAMGEACSSYPTTGALYYWSAKLAKRNAPVWSWTTGWFNLIGQVAITASVDFGLANFIGGFLMLTSNFKPTPLSILFIYGVLLLSHAILNSLGVHLISLINDVSVWWHLAGVAVFAGVLAVLPEHHASTSFVITDFQNNTGWSGRGSGVFVFFVGCLLAQYTITGFDASAHMSEETKHAATAAPKGMVTSVWLSGAAGYVLLLAVAFAIRPGFDYLGAAGSLITAPIFIIQDAIGTTGAKILVGIACIAQFFAGNACLTSNSRMLFAFSRDGAVPGHRIWHRVNPKRRTPTNAIWLCAFAAFLAGVPSLREAGGFPATFFAIVSIGVIGLYISYVIPVFLRLRQGADFQVGPWHLGKWGPLIGWVAVVWVVFISIICLLPQFSPITFASFNYTPVALLVLIVFVYGYWILSARKWYTGPLVQGTTAELLEIEAKFDSFSKARSSTDHFRALEDALDARVGNPEHQTKHFE